MGDSFLAMRLHSRPRTMFDQLDDCGGMSGLSVWAQPQFRAVLAFIACIVALTVIAFISDWDKLRDEARRERNAKKRWW